MLFTYAYCKGRTKSDAERRCIVGKQPVAAIAGMMELAPSITAFENTNPTYFRLVLIRSTDQCLLGRLQLFCISVCRWAGAAKTDMCTLANPLESESHF